MNDLELNNLANILLNEDDFKIISIKNNISILHDIKLNIWYFAILDKKLKPLFLHEGEFDSICKVFNDYLLTGRIFWEYLE